MKNTPVSRHIWGAFRLRIAAVGLLVLLGAWGGYFVHAQAQREIIGPVASSDQKVSRVKADLRSLATAIESYFIDTNTYPASTMDVRTTPDSALAAEHGGANWKVPQFRRKMGPGDPLMTLTTPISYITGYFPDPFGQPEGRKYLYHPAVKIAANKPGSKPVHGWICWSAGPDGDYDLDWNQYNPALENPMPPLMDWIYDPTNGSTSNGDIFRTKQ